MSIVAMKKKMEAKRGLSTGGKGFSINPKVKCSDVNSTTVGSARQARQNLVKRAVCFSGSEGIQCERLGRKKSSQLYGSVIPSHRKNILKKNELMPPVAKMFFLILTTPSQMYLHLLLSIIMILKDTKLNISAKNLLLTGIMQINTLVILYQVLGMSVLRQWRNYRMPITYKFC